MKQRQNSSVLMQNSVSRKSKAKLIIHVSSLPWRTVVVTSVVETGGLVRTQEKNEWMDLWLRWLPASSETNNESRSQHLNATEKMYNGIPLKLASSSTTHSVWLTLSKCLNLNGKNTKSTKSMFQFCHHVYFVWTVTKNVRNSFCIQPAIFKKNEKRGLNTLWKHCSTYESDILSSVLHLSMILHYQKTMSTSPHGARLRVTSAAAKATSWREHFKGNPFTFREVCLWQGKHFRRHLARCSEFINTSPTMTTTLRLLFEGTGRRIRAKVWSQTDRWKQTVWWALIKGLKANWEHTCLRLK